MLLAIDVGNTNIVLGAFDGTKMVKSFRVATSYEKSRDEYGMMFMQLLLFNSIKVEDIEDVIISSVVPPVMYSLERAVTKYLGKKPIVVTNQLDLGLNICYENPREVGADRLVNAVAVHEKYKCDAIIIDFGIKISVEALFSKTSKLPRIELTPTKTVIGRTTVSSMQSGVIHGYVGQVDYMVKLMREEMGVNAKVIATGGLSGMISEESSTIEVIEPNLTLDGLRIIYDRLKVKGND